MWFPQSTEWGSTQHGPWWLRSVWVISSRCPEGKGRAMSHCPYSGWARRVTRNPSSSGKTAESPDPAAHQDPRGCELGPTSTGSVPGHIAGYTELDKTSRLQPSEVAHGK